MKRRTIVSSLLLLFFASPLLPSQAPAAPQAGAKELLGQVGKVMKEVEKLRGLPYLHEVAKGICTVKEFKAFALKEMKEELPEEKARVLETAYTALGLLRPGTDIRAELIKLLGAQVAGFYDPKTKVFKLVKEKANGGAALIIMAHELTHALDDQYYDLQAHADASKASGDQEFAFESVAEGSAVTLQARYMLKAQAEGTLNMEALMAQAKSEQAQAKAMESSPPLLVADLVGRYLMGMYFLSKGDIKNVRAGCAKALETAMFDPPLSSEQIMHPNKYWDPAKRDDPVRIAFPGAEEILGKGWRCLEMETLGEIQCALLARPKDFKLRVRGAIMGNPNFWTNRAAAGWGGDRLAVYQDRDGDEAVLWVAAWDTLKDAGQFLKAFKETRGDLPSAILAEGKVTAFAFGLEKERARTVLEALLPRLRFRKGGSWNPGFPSK